MATMRDVATLANVSAKTVSRVFNNDPHVAADTKERVEAALRELSYVPNSLATAFRNQRAHVVAVAVPDIGDPFFASLTKIVETMAAERGMSVVMTSIGDDPEREPEAVQSLLRLPLSGLVLAPVAAHHGYLGSWTEQLPVVFVDRAPSGLQHADSFTEDDVSGAALATSHLIAHGHSRVGFIGDDPAIPTTRGRLEGYRAAMARAGLPQRDDLVVLGAHDRLGAAAAYEQLERSEPTALFCSNSRAAMSLAPILGDSGMAVTAYGDFPLADLLTPSLTVIDQNPRELGRLAAQRIFDRLDHPMRRFRRRNVLPGPNLVERNSCKVTDRLESVDAQDVERGRRPTV